MISDPSRFPVSRFKASNTVTSIFYLVGGCVDAQASSLNNAGCCHYQRSLFFSRIKEIHNIRNEKMEKTLKKRKRKDYAGSDNTQHN